MNNRGIAHRGLGNPDAAIDDYDRALELDANYRDAYNNRGIAEADKDDLEAAIEDFSTAIRLDPGFWHAYGQRGMVFWKLGRRAEAERDYALASKLALGKKP